VVTITAQIVIFPILIMKYLNDRQKSSHSTCSIKSWGCQY